MLLFKSTSPDTPIEQIRRVKSSTPHSDQCFYILQFKDLPLDVLDPVFAIETSNNILIKPLRLVLSTNFLDLYGYLKKLAPYIHDPQDSLQLTYLPTFHKGYYLANLPYPILLSFVTQFYIETIIASTDDFNKAALLLSCVFCDYYRELPEDIVSLTDEDVYIVEAITTLRGFCSDDLNLNDVLPAADAWPGLYSQRIPIMEDCLQQVANHYKSLPLSELFLMLFGLALYEKPQTGLMPIYPIQNLLLKADIPPFVVAELFNKEYLLYGSEIFKILPDVLTFMQILDKPVKEEKGITYANPDILRLSCIIDQLGNHGLAPYLTHLLRVYLSLKELDHYGFAPYLEHLKGVYSSEEKPGGSSQMILKKLEEKEVANSTPLEKPSTQQQATPINHEINLTIEPLKPMSLRGTRQLTIFPVERFQDRSSLTPISQTDSLDQKSPTSP